VRDKLVVWQLHEDAASILMQLPNNLLEGTMCCFLVAVVDELYYEMHVSWLFHLAGQNKEIFNGFF